MQSNLARQGRRQALAEVRRWRTSALWRGRPDPPLNAGIVSSTALKLHFVNGAIHWQRPVTPVLWDLQNWCLGSNGTPRV